MGEQPWAPQGGASALAEQGASLPPELGLISFVWVFGRGGRTVGHARLGGMRFSDGVSGGGCAWRVSRLSLASGDPRTNLFEHATQNPP